MRLLATYLLDIERAKEKVTAHHHGDHRGFFDLLRMAYIFDNAQMYPSIQSTVAKDKTWEITEVLDRFKEPAPNGYRDLKIRTRLKQNGFIATQRFVHPAMIESHCQCLPIDTELAVIDARTRIEENNSAVVVLDHFNYQEPEGRTLVEGFPDYASARRYADIRLGSNIQSLREVSQPNQDMLQLWLILGEDVVAISSHSENEHYRAFQKFDDLVNTQDMLLDQRWIEEAKSFSLQISAL